MRKMKNLLQDSVQYMNKVGIFLSGKDADKRNMLLQTLVVFIYLFIIVTGFVQYANISKNDVLNIIYISEGLASPVQLMGKLCCSVYYKDKFMNLLNSSSQFWISDDCSKSTRRDIEFMRKIIHITQNSFRYTAYGLAVLLPLSTYFAGNNLPLGVWTFDNFGFLYKLDWGVTLVSLFYSVHVISNFDNIFLGFTAEMVIQFRILCDRLTRLSVESIESDDGFASHYEKLKTNIEHHKFLLRFMDKFQDCYSPIFMVSYATIIPLVCSEIYVATIYFRNSAMLIRHGLSGVVCLLQFSFYCIPMDFLSSEAATVSEALYNSNWYSKHSKALRVPLLFMMQVSQKEKRFLAGGLIEMNIETLIKVLKFIASVASLLVGLNG